MLEVIIVTRGWTPGFLTNVTTPYILYSRVHQAPERYRDAGLLVVLYIGTCSRFLPKHNGANISKYGSRDNVVH